MALAAYSVTAVSRSYQVKSSTESLNLLQRGSSVALMISSRGGDLGAALGASSRLWSPGDVKANLIETQCRQFLGDAQPWPQDTMGTERRELSRQNWLDARNRLERRCTGFCQRLKAMPAERDDELGTLAAAWLTNAIVLAYLEAQSPEQIAKVWDTIGRDLVMAIESRSTGATLSVEEHADLFFGAQAHGSESRREARRLEQRRARIVKGRCDDIFVETVSPDVWIPPLEHQKSVAAFERGKAMWESVRNQLPEGTDLRAYAETFVYSFTTVDEARKLVCIYDPLTMVKRSIGLMHPDEPF